MDQRRNHLVPPFSLRLTPLLSVGEGVLSVGWLAYTHRASRANYKGARESLATRERLLRGPTHIPAQFCKCAGSEISAPALTRSGRGCRRDASRGVGGVLRSRCSSPD